MDAKLRVLSGPHAGETIQVVRGKLLVGREEDCQLRPDSEFVSRHHCVLLLDDYTLRIRDLGSKNGTFVNGRRISISETVLLHDDMISIGEMSCQIDLNPPPVVPASEVETMASSQTATLYPMNVYEGDTVQDAVGAAVPATPPPGPPPPPLKIAVPILPGMLFPDADDPNQMLPPTEH